LYDILTRDTPFPDGNGLHRYVMTGKFPEKRLVDVGASPGAREFITKLMKPYPNDRLTVGRALQEPWL
jgi:serine/threonine protein kinase